MFDTPKGVDLLIGGGVFFDLLGTDKISLQTGTLCLQDTKFGWIVTREVGNVCLLALNSIDRKLENEYKAINDHKS